MGLMFGEKYVEIIKTGRQKVLDSNSVELKRLDINMVHFGVTRIKLQGELPLTLDGQTSLIPNIELWSRERFYLE